ncbi:MAG TPA: DUF6491 family protein [Gammaproteobacteria bacterium]|nr:DUF6491 family protein [Gammaproteobacteria bacterium]
MELWKVNGWTKRGVTALAALTLGVGFTTASSARPANDAAPAANTEIRNVEPGAGVGEAVESFSILSGLYSWHAIDDNSVIVWTNPWQPYLVKLAFPSHDLQFVQAIGVTSMGSRVYAKFDAVKVRGFRYPIQGIFKLTRDEAKALTTRAS